MIGSTAQQFLTYLSHRGEETGNIRGSMKVRVPAERLGTRERLYGEDPHPPTPGGHGGVGTPPAADPPAPLAEWISVDKDETAASKGKVPLGARANQDYAKYGGQGSAGRGSTGGPPGWGSWVGGWGFWGGSSISQCCGSTGIARSIPPGWRM